MAFSKRATPLGGHHNPEIENDNPNSISSLGQDIARGTMNSFADIGRGIFDQFIGANESAQKPWSPENYPNPEQFNRPRRNERITLFSFREKKEREEISQIKELLKQIKEEIKAIKKADTALMNEISDVEKLTMQTDPKAGIYHIRFLEVVLKLLHSMRVKIGESRTWLSVLSSKKGKRGSLFAKRSKSQGTEYSMSQELSNARSIQ